MHDWVTLCAAAAGTLTSWVEFSDAQRVRMRAAYKEAGPEAVQGFKRVLEAMMDADMRRSYAELREASQ